MKSVSENGPDQSQMSENPGWQCEFDCVLLDKKKINNRTSVRYDRYLQPSSNDIKVTCYVPKWFYLTKTHLLH